MFFHQHFAKISIFLRPKSWFCIRCLTRAVLIMSPCYAVNILNNAVCSRRRLRVCLWSLAAGHRPSITVLRWRQNLVKILFFLSNFVENRFENHFFSDVINFLFWNRYVKPQDLANGCTIGMHPIHPSRQKSAALSRQSSNMFEKLKLKLMIKIVWIFMKTSSKWRTNSIFCFSCFFVHRKIYSAQGILLSSLGPPRSLARRAVVCLSPRLRVWKNY